MRKRIFGIIMMFAVCMSLSFPTFAADDAGFAGEYERLIDMADILDDEEETELLEKLDEISERQKFEIVIVTMDTLDGSTAQDYADDVYDECNYGYGGDKDGVLLLVSMEEQDWWISTHGYGVTAFTDAGIEYLAEQFIQELSDENYAKGFQIYAEQCDQFITQARTGEPYDKKNLPHEPLSFIWLAGSLAVGFVLAFIIVGSMKNKLKTVQSQETADSYVREGSMKITDSRDLFLYRKVDRTVKEKNNDSGSSTHTSSSGKTHGGSGGKF